jgi:hypothetical protein
MTIFTVRVSPDGGDAGRNAGFWRGQTPQRWRPEARLDYAEEARALAHRLGVPSDDLARIPGHAAHHAPPGYRHDLIHDIALAWLTKHPASALQAYGLARQLLWVKWRGWHRTEHRRGFSMDAVNVDGDALPRVTADGAPPQSAEAALLAYIGAGIEFEAMVIGEYSARSLWARLPAEIRPLIAARLVGEKVVGWRAKRLNAWAQAHAAEFLGF